MAFLKVLAAAEGGQLFSIGTRKVLILGRESTCDLVINRKSLSRQHAHIIADQGGYAIEDNASTNGTFVNGHRVLQRTRLNDGDQILLHDVPIQFLDQAPGGEEFQHATSPNHPRVVEAEDYEDSTLSDEIPQRNSAADRLNSLITIARHLGSSLDVSAILPRTLDLLFNMFPALSVGEIHISNAEGQLVPVAMKHGRESDSRDLTIKSSAEKLIRKVYESGHSRIEHAQPGDANSVLENQFLSTLCAPIVGAGDQVLGVIMVQSEESDRPFDEEDLELITTIAVLAAQALGYSRAHQLALRVEKNDRELETARTIQLATLPTAPPEIPGYRFYDSYTAAGKVGGDCYFYEALNDGRLVFGIADASGKGLSAALLVTRFLGELRLRLATAHSFKEALEKINRSTCHFATTSFVTACICILDPRKNTLAVGNAGHMPPLRIRPASGQVSPLKIPEGSLPFGVQLENEFHPVAYPLERGDQILLYTDGVSEAMNPQGDLYSIPRLMKLLRERASRLDLTVQHVLLDVHEFRRGAHANDDLCIVAMEREA